MTDDPRKPLEPDVLGALALERGRPGPGPGVRARSFARLKSALGPPGGGDGGAGAPSTETPSPELTPPDLASIAPTGEGAPSAAPSFLRMHPGLVGGTGFVVGILAGAALHAAFVPAPPVATTTLPPAAAAVSTPAPPSAAPPAPLPARTSEPAPAPERVSTADTPAVAASSGSNLTAERALLDVARAALARGEPSAASDALNQHQKRFARGVFREEREALTIQVLRDTGRLDEARRRAIAFRARYPKSLFLSTVDRVLEANP